MDSTPPPPPPPLVEWVGHTSRRYFCFKSQAPPTIDHARNRHTCPRSHRLPPPSSLEKLLSDILPPYASNFSPKMTVHISLPQSSHPRQPPLTLFRAFTTVGNTFFLLFRPVLCAFITSHFPCFLVEISKEAASVLYPTSMLTKNYPLLREKISEDLDE